MTAQSKAECPKCKSISVDIILAPPTIGGFEVTFKACSVCEYVMNEDDIKKFFESIKLK